MPKMSESRNRRLCLFKDGDQCIKKKTLINKNMPSKLLLHDRDSNQIQFKLINK